MSPHTSFHAWRADGLASGTHLGTVAGPQRLCLDEPAGRRVLTGSDGRAHDYEWASWVSPVVTPGHRFDSLVPSWNACTPADSWLEVEARASGDGSVWTRWYSLGRWAETDDEITPTTLPDQPGEQAEVCIEVLTAHEGISWSAFQLRLVLHRRTGSVAVPEVGLLAAATAATQTDAVRSGPPGGLAHGRELHVPAYSQQVHRGELPHRGGGGEAWCSPTSTAMVLGRWGLGPKAEDYTWLDGSCGQRFVDHAALHVFDQAYGGAGNWSFNTAYAARYGAEAFVTRLRSLAEAELFVAAGIPLVASVSFRAGDLHGSGYDTAGHLLTIVGFDEHGDVICHDPASHELPSNDEVRVVYERDQLERVWLAGSAGVVYVIRPHDVPLPAVPVPDEANW